ncbi:hypothetical protein KL921_000663 [Ogataea angusta]|uniref:Ribophorin II C-terminal domain-containing protein n=1 Tax=Pichia angusta TaxID=870730 RepID=A0ABQ7S4H9_PICAN|nr:hypothetical protein KL921_000663 [Ogataea angusta]KAG7842939.1 hypothetical protein KL942_000035 [Ogataea angusta]KAG7852909.1 hypothetical protein KL940_000610 [Ogataea angusta]KAG7854532.1 hypothetical protein KL939_004805 [Ogataea angusta]
MLSLAFLLLCVPVWTLELANGFLNIDGAAVSFEGSPIELEPTSKSIEIQFDILDEGKKLKSPPQQVSIIFTADNVDSYYYPKIKDSQAKLSLPLGKLSKYIKHSPEIDVSVLIGDNVKENNLFQKVGQIHSHLRSVPKPERFGSKPEIIHQFKSPQSHVNPIISIIFIGGVVALLAALFITWNQLDAVNFDNIGKLPCGYTVQFFVCLALLENIFIHYFLSASIFTTIYRTLIVAPVGVYVGSKVLRELHQLRQAGKR